MYETVVNKFNTFFKVRRNVIFERAQFNRRNQLDGETAEQYIMEVYRLAKSCDYSDLKDKIIRDRLVMGIRDAVLSQELQLGPNLTLEKAKKMVRQREAVHDHQQVLKGVSNKTHVVKELRTKGRSTQPSGSTTKPKQHQRQPQNHQKQCTRRDKGQHPKDKCPAKEAMCYHCKCKGHFGAQCFSKSVEKLSSDNYLDMAFLDTLSSTHESAWLAKMKLCDQDTEFKLDTGAEVTAMSEQSFKCLGEQKLSSPGKTLYGPSHQLLQEAGQLQGKFSYMNKKSSRDGVCGEWAQD